MSDFIKWLYANYIKPHLDTIPKGEGNYRSFGLFFALLLLKHLGGRTYVSACSPGLPRHVGSSVTPSR